MTAEPTMDEADRVCLIEARELINRLAFSHGLRLVVDTVGVLPRQRDRLEIMVRKVEMVKRESLEKLA